MDWQWLRERGLAPEALAARLRHVRWLGGGSGAGKSTVARRISGDYGLRLYSTDDAMAAHAARTRPADAPLLHAFMAMSMDERWADRAPAEMFASFHWFQGEGFGLILDDLLAHPDAPLTIAEGFRLLPRLVAPLLSQPNQGAWLIPTPAFRRAAFASRGSLWEVANKTSQPDQALANLLARDALFTDELTQETARLHLQAITVDGAESAGELARRVAAWFGLDAPQP